MGISWFKRLTETDVQRDARVDDEVKRKKKQHEDDIEALKQTPDFKQAVIDAIAKIKNDEKQIELDEIAKHEDALKKAKVDVQIVGESMQDSPEPFANVLAAGFSKENGIEVKIDFNPAFIKYLNSFNIIGIDDEETIRIWLAHMADDIIREEIIDDYRLNGVDESVKPAMNYDEMMEVMKDEDDENVDSRRQ